jgi:predicted glycosyltransferase
MLSSEESCQPPVLAKALKELVHRPPPSQTSQALTLEGLRNISQIVGDLLEEARAQLTVVKG